jgi:c-di-GMP-binding flagellar brake protein YcgR
MSTPEQSALSSPRVESRLHARRWERYEISIAVNVTVFVDGQRSNFRGEACNISKGGLRLFITRELELGTSVILEFLIPYHATELILRGVIRNRDGFSHGVEFLNPTPHQQQMIERTCKVLKLLS